MIQKRTMRLCVFIAAIAAGYVTGFRQTAAAADIELLQKQLLEGKLTEASEKLTADVEANPKDQQAKFALGTVQFLQAVEGLGRDHFRHGLLNHRRARMTMMRLPVSPNPEPELLTYDGARQVVQNYVDRLLIAERTLSEVTEDSVRLPLRVDQIRIDLDGNGSATVDESLFAILQFLRDPRFQVPPVLPQISITFDYADVHWLRGYCHVMSGFGEIVLAHDWKDQFERTAHLFFPRVETPHTFLAEEGIGDFEGFNTENLLDVIAVIHTINYEVKEPDRMQAALGHFEKVIELSRTSFASIERETDNDHEWIPNPQQTSNPLGMRVGANMISGWKAFLDEMELILQGKKLLPFWRGVPGGSGWTVFSGDFSNVRMHPRLGINVRKIFTEPRRFDMVLWIQGTGAQPFLEEGPRTESLTWNRITREFNGDFLLFMFWFN